MANVLLYDKNFYLLSFCKIFEERTENDLEQLNIWNFEYLKGRWYGKRRNFTQAMNNGLIYFKIEEEFFLLHIFVTKAKT